MNLLLEPAGSVYLTWEQSAKPISLQKLPLGADLRRQRARYPERPIDCELEIIALLVCLRRSVR